MALTDGNMKVWIGKKKIISKVGMENPEDNETDVIVWKNLFFLFFGSIIALYIIYNHWQNNGRIVICNKSGKQDKFIFF